MLLNGSWSSWACLALSTIGANADHIKKRRETFSVHLRSFSLRVKIFVFSKKFFIFWSQFSTFSVHEFRNSIWINLDFTVFCNKKKIYFSYFSNSPAKDITKIKTNPSSVRPYPKRAIIMPYYNRIKSYGIHPQSL